MSGSPLVGPRGLGVPGAGPSSDRTPQQLPERRVDELVVGFVDADAGEVAVDGVDDPDLVRYEDSFRLCYVRGPERIIVMLSEQLR